MVAPDRRDEASASLLAESFLAASVVPLRERRCDAVSGAGVDGVDEGVLKRDRGGSVVVGDVASGVVVLTRRLGVISLAALGVDDAVWLSALFCFLILAILSSSLT